jgi:hypothetical protein
MAECFNGWRRKFGCVMLAMAIAFMVGWVRSYLEVDEFTISTARSHQRFESNSGLLTWEHITEFDVTPGDRLESRLWIGVVPYWSLVSPLALFSLWLLLSKPRKSTPEKFSVPTNNGAA